MLSLRYVPLTRQIVTLPLFNVARTFATTAKFVRPVKPIKQKPAAELRKAQKDYKGIERQLAAKTKSVEKLAKERARKDKQKALAKAKLAKERARKDEKKALAQAKLAKQKAKKDEKKLEKNALKTFKRINSYNLFFKQAGSQKFADVAQEWKQLSEAKKEKWAAEATKYNDELLKKFPPKPKAPTRGYAAFVKEHFPHDSDKPFAEISKGIANQWKQLTQAEKDAYRASQSEYEKYHQALDLWKQQRLAAYKEHITTKRSEVI